MTHQCFLSLILGSEILCGKKTTKLAKEWHYEIYGHGNPRNAGKEVELKEGNILIGNFTT